MPEISVRADGPYVVTGAPLHRRHVVASEYGEPLTWSTSPALEAGERYFLCRCGGSSNKPFCDASHASNGFAAEDAAGGTYDERSKVLGGTGVTVRDDRSICAHAGFCGNRVTNVWKSIRATDDAAVRAQVMNMVERCPSGALAYEVEPLLPRVIGVVDDGPLAVMGGIPVTLADGSTLEVRNRVTLCRCGQSASKPLCDGSHKEAGFTDA